MTFCGVMYHTCVTGRKMSGFFLSIIPPILAIKCCALFTSPAKNCTSLIVWLRKNLGKPMLR
ncbi:hypothetical protein BDR06DRAFT_1054453 [Suillus hirtellus]|nr:hypothetical protein BDR06DRAFT_1054453 [Suillus hirtellus]